MNIPHPRAGSYPLRAGNAVRPLIDGEPAFRRIGEAIEQAQHSVWLTVAFFAPDFRMPAARGSLCDVLDRAVARASTFELFSGDQILRAAASVGPFRGLQQTATS